MHPDVIAATRRLDYSEFLASDFARQLTHELHCLHICESLKAVLNHSAEFRFYTQCAPVNVPVLVRTRLLNF
jgi:hypothetical protein